MSTTPAVDAAALQTLADGFAGRVLQRADDGYDDARRVHNGLIDRRPALIVLRRRGRRRRGGAVRYARAVTRSRSEAAVTTWPGARVPRAA